MMKIKVWYYEKELKENICRELKNLKPRRYMCGWKFEKLIKYIEEELYWLDVEKEQVEEIVIYNEKEHWQQSIRK